MSCLVYPASVTRHESTHFSPKLPQTPVTPQCSTLHYTHVIAAHPTHIVRKVTSMSALSLLSWLCTEEKQHQCKCLLCWSLSFFDCFPTVQRPGFSCVVQATSELCLGSLFLPVANRLTAPVMLWGQMRHFLGASAGMSPVDLEFKTTNIENTTRDLSWAA